ncbi:hypothetical protein [Arsenicicoccus dermatophilus]|uniref:hypothetical protein n=1 Tax=Arsenicicoccus dermatophilus TaxID=1076331 RepID=UPI0039170550
MILAAILSVAEVRRRREQDALKAELAEVERRELLAGDLAAVAQGEGQVRSGDEDGPSGIRSRGDRPDPRPGAAAGAAGRHRPC